MVDNHSIINELSDAESTETSVPSQASARVHKSTFRLPMPTYKAFEHFRKADNPLISDSIINAELVNDGLRYRGFYYDSESESWVKQ